MVSGGDGMLLADCLLRCCCCDASVVGGGGGGSGVEPAVGVVLVLP